MPIGAAAAESVELVGDPGVAVPLSEFSGDVMTNRRMPATRYSRTLPWRIAARRGHDFPHIGDARLEPLVVRRQQPRKIVRVSALATPQNMPHSVCIATSEIASFIAALFDSPMRKKGADPPSRVR